MVVECAVQICAGVADAPRQPPLLFPGAVDAAPFALVMLAVTGAALDAVAMIR